MCARSEKEIGCNFGARGSNSMWSAAPQFTPKGQRCDHMRLA
jgi:hypothetical protein